MQAAVLGNLCNTELVLPSLLLEKLAFDIPGNRTWTFQMKLLIWSNAILPALPMNIPCLVENPGSYNFIQFLVFCIIDGLSSTRSKMLRAEVDLFSLSCTWGLCFLALTLWFSTNQDIIQHLVSEKEALVTQTWSWQKSWFMNMNTLDSGGKGWEVPW